MKKLDVFVDLKSSQPVFLEILLPLQFPLTCLSGTSDSSIFSLFTVSHMSFGLSVFFFFIFLLVTQSGCFLLTSLLVYTLYSATSNLLLNPSTELLTLLVRLRFSLLDFHLILMSEIRVL